MSLEALLTTLFPPPPLPKSCLRGLLTCPNRLFVDNKGKNYIKLIKMYTEYGFTLVSNDGNITTMEFKCK